MIVFNSIYIEILYGKTFYIRERVTLKMDIDQIVNKENSLCPAQLEGRLNGIPLSTLSHHLKQLSDCGILNSEKQGTYIYYSLNEDIAKKFVPDLYDISIKPGKPKS
jgi:DNA-binding transcriptional ArsR family regulator